MVLFEGLKFSFNSVSLALRNSCLRLNRLLPCILNFLTISIELFKVPHQKLIRYGFLERFSAFNPSQQPTALPQKFVTWAGAQTPLQLQAHGKQNAYRTTVFIGAYASWQQAEEAPFHRSFEMLLVSEIAQLWSNQCEAKKSVEQIERNPGQRTKEKCLAYTNYH